MIQQHREDGGLPEESARSPNELDQTDESQNAADITRAGQAKASKRRPDAPDDRTASRAPDGKTSERYAG
jgi:hypothetical protein